MPSDIYPIKFLEASPVIPSTLLLQKAHVWPKLYTTSAGCFQSDAKDVKNYLGNSFWIPFVNFFGNCSSKLSDFFGVLFDYIFRNNSIYTFVFYIQKLLHEFMWKFYRKTHSLAISLQVHLFGTFFRISIYNFFRIHELPRRITCSNRKRMVMISIPSNTTSIFFFFIKFFFHQFNTIRRLTLTLFQVNALTMRAAK